MTQDYRLSILRFLHFHVFKSKAEDVPVKVLRLLHKIMFPLDSYAIKKAGFKYEWVTGIFTIHGVKVNEYVFKVMQKQTKEDERMMLRLHNGKWIVDNTYRNDQ